MKAVIVHREDSEDIVDDFYIPEIKTDFLALGHQGDSDKKHEFHRLDYDEMAPETRDDLENAARGIALERADEEYYKILIRRHVEIDEAYLNRMERALKTPKNKGLLKLIIGEELESIPVNLEDYRNQKRGLFDEHKDFRLFDSYWAGSGCFDFIPGDDGEFCEPCYEKIFGYFQDMDKEGFGTDMAIAAAVNRLDKAYQIAFIIGRENGVEPRSVDDAMKCFFDFLSSNQNMKNGKEREGELIGDVARKTSEGCLVFREFP